MVRTCCILLTILLAGCNNGGNEIKPQVKPLMEAVYASGYLYARNQYEVFAQAEGYVLEQVVQDGSDIRKGEPIYILESGQQSSRFDLARKNYSLARDNYQDGSPVLNEVVAAMNSARTKMQFDSVNFVRYSNLLKRNATSKAEYDRFSLTYENARNEFLLHQSRYDRLKRQLYLELENAKSQLSIAGNESGRYILKSEIDGRVFKTLKDKGELVRRGEVVAVVGNKNEYYLELAVDEVDINKVKTGQDVLVTIDAFPDRVFNAKVSSVYPIVNLQQQSIRVDAVLSDSLPGFYAGLAVEANIVIRRNDHALVLPRNMVRNDTVFIQTDDGIMPAKIVRGIQTFEEVEVVSGIDSNSLVVAPK
jgi:HlyD family secretion protein